MRRLSTWIAWTAAGAAAWSTARAHPGHGDAAHFLTGASHDTEGAHSVLAHPYFAAALLVVSLLVLGLAAARARSLGLPRPRRALIPRSRASD